MTRTATSNRRMGGQCVRQHCADPAPSQNHDEIRWVAPSWAELVGRQRLDELTVLLSIPHPDEAFYGRRPRDVLRLTPPSGGSALGELFVARETGPLGRCARAVRRIARTLRAMSYTDVAAQRRILTHLRSRGLWVPEPIVHVADQATTQRAALVCLNLGDSWPPASVDEPQRHVATRPLAEWLAHTADADAAASTERHAAKGRRDGGPAA
ncbi:MAG: hypothetical protein R3C10_24965 [Pirellulales bacterium]